MNRVTKYLRWTAAATAFLTGVLIVAAAVVLPSDWFREQVRLRILREAEKATGGRAELGSFHFDWRHLRAEARDFVLHGTEPPNEAPLFRVDRIVVGLKVVSVFRRDVDLALLELDRPVLWIRKDAEGRSNLPRPAAARPGKEERNLLRPIVRLAVREFRLNNGEWRYGGRKGTADFRGEDLVTRAVYDPQLAGYRVESRWRQLLLRAPQAVPVAFDAAVSLAVTEKRIELERADFQAGESRIEASGRVLAGRESSGRIQVRSILALADLAAPLKLPVDPAGRVELEGVAAWSRREPFSLEGEFTAAGLRVRNRRVDLPGIGGHGHFAATAGEIRVDPLVVTLLNGEFRGRTLVRGFREFETAGSLSGLSLKEILPHVRVRAGEWNAVLSGDVQARGRFTGPVEGRARLALEPGIQTGIPIQGFVEAVFDSAAGDVKFATSEVNAGASRIAFAGSLRNGLEVSVFSENLAELLPGLAYFGAEPPHPFPVRLDGGVMQFAGLVSGALGEPRIAGHLALGPFRFQGRLIEHGAADFDLTARRLRLRRLTVRHRKTALRGDFEMELENWRPVRAGRIKGEFGVDAGSIAEALEAAAIGEPLEGEFDLAAALNGTLGDPVLIARVTARDLTAYGERFDAAAVNMRYTRRSILIENAAARAGAGRLSFHGTYQAESDDWRDGRLQWELEAQGFRIHQFQRVREFREGLDAGLQATVSGTLELRRSRPRLAALNGEVRLAKLLLEGRRLGDAAITARTRRNILVVGASASLKDARIRADAQWNLARESFGLGQVDFRNLTLAALQDLGLFGGPGTDLHLKGSMDGEIGFVGPILQPSKWRGIAKVTRMELTPVAPNRTSDRDLTLRNEGPLIFAIEPARIAIQTARLTSPDTDLQLSGTLSYLRRNPWNLRLQGSLDLSMLTAFREDLMAEGRSTVDAWVRGSLLQPQINGRLEFENAAFRLRDLPNGLEQVNGAILFNRTRATFEKFTSKTGGGELRLSGFIGFGGEEWVYRLHGQAQRVRIRYPEGVSMIIDAELDLTGSATRSLLSGDVEVRRAAFNPGSDIGGLLSRTAARGAPAVITNPFLRGMQFDLRILTAADAEFVTSLTRDIEVEADLRLRGTIVRPVLLGRIGINRGEIQFFGNRYTIVRGEVQFFNPVKIEPVIAMDLETRIRGYTVMMNFSGPLDKLNFSYRSDPPLQSQEIIALLTVGRTPMYTGSPTASAPSGTGYFQAGGSSFLGHALTAPVSNRLQRFFGVSRIKIDPQLTGVENTPETHVTIEQQISREITLTYVTNLTRTQQQIVRIEWNFHPNWSFFAIRDSNGVFGVDFVYRRRFR